MAQITTTIDEGLDLTERTVTGELSTAEVFAVFEQFYRGKPTKRVLWDITAADIGTITSADFSRIAAAVAQYGVRFGEIKTAAVVSSDFAYGMTRMYQALRERSMVKAPFMSFRSREEAIAWLTSDTPAEAED